MNLSFATSEEPVVATRDRVIDHIGFELDDLEAFCRSLAAKGISFDVEYHEIEGMELKSASITDPSGVSIELTEGLDRY